MSSDAGSVIREELNELGDHLRLELHAEIERLYNRDDLLDERDAELQELERRLHASTVLVGDLRQQLVRAERKLEDLQVEEISKARRDALFLGTGFVRIICRGRGQYTTKRVNPDRIALRGD